MNDLISRQAAIDAVEKESRVDGAYGYMDTKSIVDLLNDLPSAQPELTQNLHNACTDLISRQEVIKLLDEAWVDGHEYQGWLHDEVNRLPSAQPEPTTEIQEILDYLDTTLHPIVSPDNWNVYAELHDMVSKLQSAQPDNRLSKIADLVEGTIDHFDLDDAMDLLYQIKEVLK